MPISVSAGMSSVPPHSHAGDHPCGGAYDKKAAAPTAASTPCTEHHCGEQLIQRG
ncbi:MAG: hypothetical protein ACLRTX_07155 [Christensenellales bacterium]